MQLVQGSKLSSLLGACVLLGNVHNRDPLTACDCSLDCIGHVVCCSPECHPADYTQCCRSGVIARLCFGVLPGQTRLRPSVKSFSPIHIRYGSIDDHKPGNSAYGELNAHVEAAVNPIRPTEYKQCNVNAVRLLLTVLQNQRQKSEVWILRLGCARDQVTNHELWGSQQQLHSAED